MTQSNVNRLSKFNWYTEQEICNKVIIKYLTAPQARRYTTLQNICQKASVHCALGQSW